MESIALYLAIAFTPIGSGKVQGVTQDYWTSRRALVTIATPRDSIKVAVILMCNDVETIRPYPDNLCVIGVHWKRGVPDWLIRSHLRSFDRLECVRRVIPMHSTGLRIPSKR